MKPTLLTVLFLTVFSFPVLAQLDAESAKELNRRKELAKKNKTLLWMYDTLYKAGEPHCLLKSRVQSESGNEYIVKGLNSKEIIYIIEPGNIEKLINKITADANVEFSFLEEKQKLNVPKKSVESLPDFIIENNLVVGNSGNMKAVEKLLFIYNDRNKHGYTANVDLDSLKQGKKDKPEKKVDTAVYTPVVRDKKFPIQINDYVIRQNGIIIGRYIKTSPSQGVSDNRTRFTIKSPDWKDVVIATNKGFGSSNWRIEFVGSKKRETYHTSSPLHKKALKEIVTFLVNNNYL